MTDTVRTHPTVAIGRPEGGRGEMSRREEPGASHPRCRLGAVWMLLFTAACGSPPTEVPAIRFVDHFGEATVDNAVAVQAPQNPASWTFDGEAVDPVSGEPSRTFGWTALDGITDLNVREQRLIGRTTGPASLLAPGPRDPDPNDFFHAIEIELRVSAGARLGVSFESEEELDTDELIDELEDASFLDFNIDLVPGDAARTYTLTGANARFRSSYPLSSIRHLLIRPTDAAGADFEITSVRLVTVREHLASIPSGIGWYGLDEVYRETLVSRSPERITFQVEMPSQPMLDLSIGTIDARPITFRIEAETDGQLTPILRRTITTPQRWHSAPVDLSGLASRRVALTLVLEAEEAGAPGFWGSPAIRNVAGQPVFTESSPARDLMAGKDAPPPRGVILIIADTLRRDHLQAYGYERANAPVITRLAEQGALFRDAISQGTWTKVSVSSIVTSLYPTTHGIKDMPDRMPAGVTTLAEAYRSAGYATFATSSVPFTGKLTNLHQGVEVLHESSSVPELDHSGSKTSRTYTDRLIDWIDDHRDMPFFAFLHVFDPHSPFEPYPPYETMWLEPDELVAHRQDMERVMEFIEDPFMRYQALPDREEIERSGVDIDTYVRREKAWYDASIRAMDVEIGRLVEHLEELDIAEDTLIAFISDHGEEFLEHGRHFHGYHTYGEMVNVPLILWWPLGIPAGVEVERTVQSIDLMPTLLELSRLPVPQRAQGQSLLPLLAAANPGALGWKPRPAVAERAFAPAANQGEKNAEIDSFAVVDGEWKLVWNTQRPEDWPEYELYDHQQDPLNLTDVAADHPQVVERLADYLQKWQEAALAAKVEAAAAADQLSAEELEKLRSLGYIQ